ncbi:MAG: hypothetical protein NT154_20450, partial [Verrucomicrobia bacterium]|nr:hypothetical protein [Verrucomicrobiota bacterium]
MVAYADMGGLGTKQGAPVVYNWAAPSLIPQVLPWVAILGLLMLKPNRCASAWWILIPLACVGCLASAPESILGQLPAAQISVFLELISSFGFGLAAVWLLASYLGWKHRMLAFLGILAAHGVFSCLAYAIRHSWEGNGIEALGMGVFLVAGILIMSVALTLAGLLCRGHYSLPRLCLWLIAGSLALWLVVIGPIFLIALIGGGGNVPITVPFVFIAVAAGITVGVL